MLCWIPGNFLPWEWKEWKGEWRWCKAWQKCVDCRLGILAAVTYAEHVSILYGSLMARAIKTLWSSEDEATCQRHKEGVRSDMCNLHAFMPVRYPIDYLLLLLVEHLLYGLPVGGLNTSCSTAQLDERNFLLWCQQTLGLSSIMLKWCNHYYVILEEFWKKFCEIGLLLHQSETNKENEVLRPQL